MADKTISGGPPGGLPPLGVAPDPTSELPIDEGGTTYAVTVSNLGDAVVASFVTADLGTDVVMAGTYGAIPAAGTAGRLYFATDTATLYRDSGAAWVQVADTAKPKSVITLQIFDDNAALATGDGKKVWFVPQELNGMNLVAAHATVKTVSSGAAPAVMVHNLTDTTDMLSTGITIDANEFTSYTAATPPVINAAADDVATGDRIRIDVDTAGTGATGLAVILTFQLP